MDVTGVPGAERDESDPFAFVGLTFDDVLLVPRQSDVTPSEVETRTRVSRNIELAVPLVSSAMDTVTESRMAIAMARQGGIGVIHRNLSIADQASQVDRVKRSESGMVSDPLTVGPDATLAELDDLCGQYRVSGLPVIDHDRVLLGIITNRDLRFIPRADYPRLKVRDAMTPMPLVTAPVGVASEEAARLLAKHRVEKLPIVDQ
ncbi:MAG: IMP dehydrogenase, partial [Bifidobacteriaceae bacterium]|nr:IMP dehydrogenase [Bifidobacteriaceae bacterium]